MSYNGIGLSTTRGSGTSGYIQANAAQRGVYRTGKYEHRREMEEKAKYDEKKLKATGLSDRTIDQGLLEHEEKRKVEVKCFELQNELEDKGAGESEIEERVGELRQRLTSEQHKQKLYKPSSSSESRNSDRGKYSMLDRRSIKSGDIHGQSAEKVRQNDRMQQVMRESRVRKGRHDDRGSYERRDRYSGRDEQDQRDRYGYERSDRHKRRYDREGRDSSERRSYGTRDDERRDDERPSEYESRGNRRDGREEREGTGYSGKSTRDRDRRDRDFRDRSPDGYERSFQGRRSNDGLEVQEGRRSPSPIRSSIETGLVKERPSRNLQPYE